MKKIAVLILLSVLMFSGCAKSEPFPEALTENFDNSGEKTVVYFGEKTVPISFTLDGVHQIENGTYWYYELSHYLREWNDPFYTYDIQKRELNGLKEYKDIKKGFATNGNWPLFLYPVHTEYTASNQNGIDESLLSAAKDAVITDLWTIDLDGDNNQESIFLSKNNSAGTFALGYSKEGMIQELYSGHGDALDPILCDLNGDGNWEMIVHKASNYNSMSVYDFKDDAFIRRYEIIY